MSVSNSADGHCENFDLFAGVELAEPSPEVDGAVLERVKADLKRRRARSGRTAWLMNAVTLAAACGIAAMLTLDRPDVDRSPRTTAPPGSEPLALTGKAGHATQPEARPSAAVIGSLRSTLGELRRTLAEVAGAVGSADGILEAEARARTAACLERIEALEGGLENLGPVDERAL